MQLLLPRTDVEDALRQYHAGDTAGHFGIQKTLDQVKRRFYWPSSREDTKRFCRRCAECNEYHRGKLKRLKLGREARLPLDIVYGSPDEEPAEDYDRFVERVRERTTLENNFARTSYENFRRTTPFAEVRENLKRSAERNKRYNNLGVKSKRFEVGQWVLYFKTKRKLRGKQMKCRNSEICEDSCKRILFRLNGHSLLMVPRPDFHRRCQEAVWPHVQALEIGRAHV